MTWARNVPGGLVDHSYEVMKLSLNIKSSFSFGDFSCFMILLKVSGLTNIVRA